MKSSRALAFLLVLLIASSTQATAQSNGGSSAAITTSLKTLHDITANNVMETATMLEEDIYAFQPTEEVRTTGELLAHIANAQFMFCSIAAGADNPSEVNFEETATTKEDIIAALEAGFDYCAGVYEGMTDETGAEMTNVFGMEMARSAVLAFNSTHNYEHYGNLVTYMRINGIVPPSSM